MSKDKVTSVRVFVSSTFADMHNERDYLNRTIFPKLKNLCNERGLNFFAIDLRWGITKEDQRKGRVLPMCVKGIDNSRPFFIGILGERYGWIPDDLDDLKEDFPDLMKHTGKSVTELEMIYGVLDNPGRDDGFYSFYLRDESLSREFDNDSGSELEKLNELKSVIRKSGFPYLDGYKSVEEMGARVEEDFIKWLNINFPVGFDTEKNRQQAYSREIDSFNAGNLQLENFLEDYFANHIEPILLVSNNQIAMKIINRYVIEQKNNFDSIIINVAASDKMQDYINIIKYLLNELKKLFPEQLSDIGTEKMTGKYGEEYRKFLEERFISVSNNLKLTKPLVILITDLHLLSEERGSKLLHWLPSALADKLSLVCTTRDTKMADMVRFVSWNSLDVDFNDHINNLSMLRLYLDNLGKNFDGMIWNTLAYAQIDIDNLFFLTDYLNNYSIFDNLNDTFMSIVELSESIPLVPAIEEQHLSGKPAEIKDLYFAAVAVLMHLRRPVPEYDFFNILHNLLNITPAQWSEVLELMKPFIDYHNGVLSVNSPLVLEHYKRFPISFANISEDDFYGFLEDYSLDLANSFNDEDHATKSEMIAEILKDGIYYAMKNKNYSRIKSFMMKPLFMFCLSLHDRDYIRAVFATVLRESDLGLYTIIDDVLREHYNGKPFDYPEYLVMDDILNMLYCMWRFLAPDDESISNVFGDINEINDYISIVYYNSEREFFKSFWLLRISLDEINSQESLDNWYEQFQNLSAIASNDYEQMAMYEIGTKYALEYSNKDFCLKMSVMFMVLASKTRSLLYLCNALYLSGKVFLLHTEKRELAFSLFNSALTLSMIVGNNNVYKISKMFIDGMEKVNGEAEAEIHKMNSIDAENVTNDLPDDNDMSNVDTGVEKRIKENVICSKCNCGIPDGLTVCYRCGNPVHTPAPHQPPAETVQEQSNVKKKKHNSLFVIVFAIVLFGVVIGGHYLGLYTLPMMPDAGRTPDPVIGSGLPGDTPQEPPGSSSGTTDTDDREPVQTPEPTPQPTPAPTPEPAPAGPVEVTDMPYILENAILKVSVLYSGSWENDAPNGRGKITYQESGSSDATRTIWARGTTLEGHFENGLLQGLGDFKTLDGDHYIGFFKNGLRHGEGTFNLANGERHSGQWENGQLNGIGRIVSPHGWSYEGDFVNGVITGWGTIKFPDGSSYEGEWVAGKYEGQGRYTHPDGSVDEGVWSDNALIRRERIRR